MDTGKDTLQSRESGASDEDATLDIVRLLVETENRRVEHHSEGPAKASYIARASEEASTPLTPQEACPTPKRGFLSKARPTEKASELADQPYTDQPFTDQPLAPLPEVEDLRPKTLGVAMPRFRVPRVSLRLPRFAWRSGRRSALRPAPEFVEPKSQKLAALRGVGCSADCSQYAKLAGLVAICCVVVFKPWVVPVLLFVLVWLLLIVFLLLGSARITDIFAGVWVYMRDKHPERSARILTRLQRAADRLDGLLARLPERLVDGIYSPDLGRSQRDIDSEQADVLGEDPFDRLVKQQRVYQGLQHGPAE